jgi:DNA-binding MarR family transcriptional regulator
LNSHDAHPADRRQVTLAQTERGQALYDELFPLVRSINAELVASLDAEEAVRFDAAPGMLQSQADRMLEAWVLPKANPGVMGTRELFLVSDLGL